MGKAVKHTVKGGQAAKWLREKGIIIEVYCFNSSFPKQLVWNFTIVDNEDRELITPDHANPFSTYEQALSAGIDKALELLKQQSNG